MYQAIISRRGILYAGLGCLALQQLDSSRRGSVAHASLSAATPLASSMASSSGEPDTITGVFHRLDTNAAKLRLVQVVFR